jgi:cobalt-precorrin 5A hydrolase
VRVVVGVGASRGVSQAEVLALVRAVLREAGVPEASVAALATVDGKAGEPAITAAAVRLGVPLMAYDAHTLAAVDVPTPSGAPLAALGTPSVAEAAALAAAPGGELLVPKRKSAPEGGAARATAAVARRRTLSHGTTEGTAL